MIDQIKTWRKSKPLIIALTLHAVIFLWLFQLDFTEKEWQRIEAQVTDNSLSSWAEAIYDESGVIGYAKYFFGKHKGLRLYYRYANLALYGDTSYWEEEENLKFDTERPLPYRDVVVEYPPGAFLAFIPPALVSSDYEEYRYRTGVWFGLIYMFNIFFGLSLLTNGPPTLSQLNRTLWISLAFLFCVGGMIVARYDHLVVTFILLSAWVFSRALQLEGTKSHLWFGAFGLVTSMGVLTKIVPGLVIPSALLALFFFGKKSPYWNGMFSSMAGLLAGLIIFNLVFYWAFGPGYFENFTYHMERGIEIESTYAGIVLLAYLLGFPVEVAHSYGSFNVISTATEGIKLISPFLFLAIAGFIFYRFWKNRRVTQTQELSQPFANYYLVFITMIFLLAFILTNKVFSPQYVIWLGPFVVVLAGVRQDFKRMGYLFLFATLMTQAIFPIFFGLLTDLHPVLIFILNFRNFALIILLVLLIRGMPQWLETERN